MIEVKVFTAEFCNWSQDVLWLVKGAMLPFDDLATVKEHDIGLETDPDPNVDVVPTVKIGDRYIKGGLHGGSEYVKALFQEIKKNEVNYMKTKYEFMCPHCLIPRQMMRLVVLDDPEISTRTCPDCGHTMYENPSKRFSGHLIDQIRSLERIATERVEKIKGLKTKLKEWKGILGIIDDEI